MSENKHWYLQDHNCVLMDVANRLELVDKPYAADGAVLWQDVIGLGRGIAQFAKQQRKPVIVFQHGVNAYIDYGPPNHYQLLADKIGVWGEKSAEMLTGYGIPENKIVITGTTIFSHLKPREKHDGINIVFRPAHWDSDTLEENKEVSEALRRIDGIKITTKIIETQKPVGFDNVVSSHRDEANHLEICADVLRTADAVVAVAGDGTFEMLAYSLDIPVIIPDVWRQKDFLGKPTPEMIYSDACELVEIEGLEGAVREAVSNPEKKRAERLEVARSWAGTSIENPLEKMLNLINNA